MTYIHIYRHREGEGKRVSQGEGRRPRERWAHCPPPRPMRQTLRMPLYTT